MQSVASNYAQATAHCPKMTGFSVDRGQSMWKAEGSATMPPSAAPKICAIRYLLFVFDGDLVTCTMPRGARSCVCVCTCGLTRSRQPATHCCLRCLLLLVVVSIRGCFRGQVFFLIKKPGLGRVALCLQPPSVTLQLPSVTLQPPSAALQPPSVTLKCHRLELCRFC